MSIQIAHDAERELFAQWRLMGRMEEITCKEIHDGKHYDNPERVTLAYRAEEQGAPIGRVDCMHFNARNHSCEIGFMIAPENRGKGYGTHMLTEVLRYLFEHYDLNKVYCQTAGFNEPSVRLLEKFGFHRDATLREHHELDGVFYDDYIYSILKREFVGKCR
jgi:[ribosomal protein S5]-alanine N-acetyltransferase